MTRSATSGQMPTLADGHHFAPKQALGALTPQLGYSRSMLKEHYPDWLYGPPTSADVIADAEAKLGVRFPDELRALYLEADGVRENLGNAAYLLPLSVEESMVSLTKTLWAEWEGFRPEFDLKPFVFFGSSTSDELWGINWKQPGQVIAFHHHMEGAYEVVGTNIADVYRTDFTQLKDRLASN